MEMGKEIRRLREDRGITQEALAEALNVTGQSVSKWERGTSMPDVQMLPQIAVFFGITIDQLFAMAPEQQMERIENRIYSQGLLEGAEERQLIQQLVAFSEQPEHAGQANTLLTKLYNHQAEQYRLLAVIQVLIQSKRADKGNKQENANGANPFMNLRHAVSPCHQ